MIEFIRDIKGKVQVKPKLFVKKSTFNQHSKKSVLIIDDDKSIRLLLEFFLRNHYDIVTKENGFEGMLWLTRGNIPDLIIADVAMPKLNGYDFLKKIKDSGYFREIPFMIISGLESSLDIIKCLQAGADDYLLKPFDPEKLLVKIKSLINKTNNEDHV